VDKVTELKVRCERRVGIANSIPCESTGSRSNEVAVIGGKPTVIEAKFVDEWASSIRNPESPAGSKTWSVAE